ncbi:hypothetical protein SAVERM_302 [Streptomyces avermitilis MA-4680 = NBRC 14893]|uniref:Uncharacterized protein n=1 Tax=Streptomyces avermitilis (strain ATCC 31267 / DSM 46492 / JCM 5070 / NBRC 14893 / NCIMB 12804 / NRRL 8165 / MA-4680) TaxID=227882 RepID=Q82R42_STRAW|nr:hypothetical protein SAVERM_302 [Streptomyces avermitilis MA-4680 = NBRC 14893]
MAGRWQCRSRSQSSPRWQRIIRPVGRARRLSGYSPGMVWSWLSARRTWRSIRQNTSRATQITWMSAATRPLCWTKTGVTARGPLKSLLNRRLVWG